MSLCHAKLHLVCLPDDLSVTDANQARTLTRVALVELEEVQMSVGPILGCERVFRAVVGVVRHGGGQVGPGPVQIFHHGC